MVRLMVSEFTVEDRVEEMRKLINAKRHVSIIDEVGVMSPISLSVVLPTISRERYVPAQYNFRMAAIGQIFKELNRLISMGYVDEVIIVDGSLNKDGKIQYNHMRDIIDIARKEITLFSDQIEMIRKHRNVAELAKRGMFDPIIKIFHQKDAAIQETMQAFGVLKLNELHEIPKGKGAALWLSVPVSSGDVIGFFDSDNRVFSSESVVLMTIPIIVKWQPGHFTSDVKFIKAFYRRLKIRELNADKFSLGGRVTRLVVPPLSNMIVKRGILKGIESFRYPLSGEIAACRECMRKFKFYAGFGVEIGHLIQVVRELNLENVMESDIGIFQHFEQPDNAIEEMVREIATAYFYSLTPEELSKIDDRDIYSEFIDEAKRVLAKFEKTFLEEVNELKRELGMEYVYDAESERSHIETYAKIVCECFKEAKERKNPPLVLKSWDEIRKKVDYFQFREVLRRKVNISTYRLMELQGMV